MHDPHIGLCRQVFETSKQIMEFALELNEIVGRSQERVVQQRSTAIEIWLEAARNELQALTDAAGTLDLLALQVDIAADLSERVLSGLQELLDIPLQASNDILQSLRQTVMTNPHPAS